MAGADKRARGRGVGIGIAAPRDRAHERLFERKRLQAVKGIL
jgi:hypothetical protein